MKELYFYDKTTKEFLGSNVVADDYIVSDGETEIKPADGLYDPITFDGTKWNGTDQAVWQAAQDAKQAEFLKTHPELAPQSTSEQQQLSELIKNNAQQSVLNAQLIKQVADLKAQLTASTTTKTQEAE